MNVPPSNVPPSGDVGERLAALARNEQVDLTVDGQRLERPVTPWS